MKPTLVVEQDVVKLHSLAEGVVDRGHPVRRPVQALTVAGRFCHLHETVDGGVSVGARVTKEDMLVGGIGLVRKYQWVVKVDVGFQAQGAKVAGTVVALAHLFDGGDPTVLQVVNRGCGGEWQQADAQCHTGCDCYQTQRSVRHGTRLATPRLGFSLNINEGVCPA